MTTFERMQKLVKDMPKMSTRQYVDESCSLLADLMEEKDELDARLTLECENHGKTLADLELYKGLLKAEQEDCQLQRKQKVANWERATRLDIALDAVLNVESYEFRKQLIDKARAESV